jgi:hypothetical protein
MRPSPRRAADDVAHAQRRPAAALRGGLVPEQAERRVAVRAQRERDRRHDLRDHRRQRGHLAADVNAIQTPLSVFCMENHNEICCAASG